MAAGELEYLRLEENKKIELRIANELVGNYECLSYDADAKTDWHYVMVTSNGDGVLKWTNRAGRSWTLTMRGVDYPYRVKPTLMTDKDCPHFESIKFVEIRRHWWWKKNVTALVFGGDSYDKVVCDKDGCCEYTIENHNARGKYLFVEGASNDDGAKLILSKNNLWPSWSDLFGRAGRWYIKRANFLDNTFNITNVKTGKCINVAGALSDNGATIHQWSDPSAANSRFRIIPKGGGVVVIQASHSGKYINVAGAATNIGAKIHQWDDPGARETQWIIRARSRARSRIATFD